MSGEGVESDTGNALQILIAGAGTMGHGLALLMAKAGHEVLLMDIDEGILDRAIKLIEAHLSSFVEAGQLDTNMISEIVGRIRTTTELSAIKTQDIIIESVPEDQDIKRSFYEKVAILCSAETIVASNTSYLDVFSLAPAFIQERLIITHFFEPPYLIPLVEVIKGPQTNPEVIQKMRKILLKAGQRPIIMEKFIPGFVVNRLQRAMGREIFHLIDGGFVKPEEIDKAVLASLGVRIPVLGVVRRYDFAGLDLALKVLSNPSIGLMDKDTVSPTLKGLVARGYTGVKAGKGFYDYHGQNLEQIYEKRDRLLMRMREVIEEIEKVMWQNPQAYEKT